uniref:Lipoprotein n=1 Tax=Mycoplasma feriruminatoris TaxID=1179777 RepID=A0A654IKV9_9MOLU|nr:hypothetical protein MF5295_00913 [Mycoplasma feriruminatoris]
MKKLLTILGSVGLIATTSAAVVACGDKMPKKVKEIKQNNEEKSDKKKDTRETKTPNEDKTTTISEFPKQDLELGVFSRNDKGYDSVSQSTIKKTLADKLKVSESDLTDLNINYDQNSGTVKSTKFLGTLSFKFSTVLDLGSFKENEKKTIPQTDIKKKLASLLNVKEQDLQELRSDYSGKNGTGTVKSTKFSGTLSFKFTVDEKSK